MAERALSSYDLASHQRLRLDAETGAATLGRHCVTAEHSDEPCELFLDWAALGVDEAGVATHVPIVEGTLIVCRCHGEGCQLDRALFRARVSGFIRALQLRADEDPVEVMEVG